MLRGASRHGSFRLLGWVTFPFFSCSVPPAFRWWLVRLCAPSRIIPHFPDVIGVVLPGWFSWIALCSRFISSRSCSDLPCVSVLVPPGCPCWWRVFIHHSVPSSCPSYCTLLDGAVIHGPARRSCVGSRFMLSPLAWCHWVPILCIYFFFHVYPP